MDIPFRNLLRPAFEPGAHVHIEIARDAVSETFSALLYIGMTADESLEFRSGVPMPDGAAVAEATRTETLRMIDAMVQHLSAVREKLAGAEFTQERGGYFMEVES